MAIWRRTNIFVVEEGHYVFSLIELIFSFQEVTPNTFLCVNHNSKSFESYEMFYVVIHSSTDDGKMVRLCLLMIIVNKGAQVSKKLQWNVCAQNTFY